MRGLKIAVVGGGGFRTPMVHAGILSRTDRLPIGELCLHDLDAGRLRRVAAVLRGQAEESRRSVPVRTTTSLADALGGADLVFCAIRVGGAPARAADERFALQLGLLGQETVGAGGILFALRTIPVMLGIAAEIERRVPNAWVLNFTNPAGIVTEALTRVLGDRVLGICDSPSALLRRVATALGRQVADLRFDYAGLNHFGWLLGVRDAGGHDLLPGLLADPARLAEIEEARLFGTGWLQALGMIPNEYLFYYDRTRAAITETIRRGATRGESLLTGQAAFYAGADEDPKAALGAWRETRLGRERTYLGEAGAGIHAADPAGDEGGYADVALDLATALGGGDPVSAVVNVPNRGTVSNLDAAAVVEVPCRVDANGAHPLPQPQLPPAAAARMGLMKAIDRLVLEAATERSRSEHSRSARSRSALLQAFGLHPLCGGVDGAEALVERALGVAEVRGGPA